MIIDWLAIDGKTERKIERRPKKKGICNFLPNRIKNVSFESLTPLTRLIFDDFSRFLKILRQKYTRHWSSLTKLPPYWIFMRLRNWSMYKQIAFLDELGDISWFMRNFHVNLWRWYVSKILEKYCDKYRTENHKRYASLIFGSIVATLATAQGLASSLIFR